LQRPRLITIYTRSNVWALTMCRCV